MARNDPRHWWNRKWRRNGRRDIYLRIQDDIVIVEACEGGKDGTWRTWEPPTEDDAYLLVDELMSDQEEWIELSASPPPPQYS